MLFLPCLLLLIHPLVSAAEDERNPAQEKPKLWGRLPRSFFQSPWLLLLISLMCQVFGLQFGIYQTANEGFSPHSNRGLAQMQQLCPLPLLGLVIHQACNQRQFLLPFGRLDIQWPCLQVPRNERHEDWLQSLESHRLIDWKQIEHCSHPWYWVLESKRALGFVKFGGLHLKTTAEERQRLIHRCERPLGQYFPSYKRWLHYLHHHASLHTLIPAIQEWILQSKLD